MQQLTQEAAQAFTNLRGNRDFETVLKWIGEYAQKETDIALSTDGTNCARAQGAVKALKHIAESNDAAPNTLAKFKQQPR